MAASVKDDWKIALMQRVLFDVGCPSRKQGMSCFSEKAMMKGVDGVVQVAKQVGVWPRVDLDKEKPYLPELKVHVKLLIKQLETEISRQQSAHEMGQFVLDMLQDPNTPHPNGENHLKNTTGRMASIEACMAAATRDIQLLKEWQNGLAKILSASGRLQSPQ